MSFAERLFEELSPADDGPDMELLCEAIGGMFQPVEDVAGDDDAGNIGYSIIMDIDRIPAGLLSWLGQFVGVNLRPGLNDDDQRAWVRATSNFKRGRPQAIKDAVAATLTGTKLVILRERDGSAWRYTVITRTSETPDTNLTHQAALEQKPAPDILSYVTEDLADYEWVKENVADYAALEANYTTYQDLIDQEI